LKYVRAISS